VKVISRGVDPKDFAYRMSCSNCKSLLEFVVGDLTSTHDQREGAYYTLKCPVCSHRNDMSYTSLVGFRYNPPGAE
jgi:RNase P subunit RPR2